MLYPTLKMLHLLSVVLLTAGTALGATTSIMARKTSKTRELAVIGQFARRVPVMTGTGSLLAMITGTLLVWKVGFGFGTPWVIAAYVTWLLAVILSGAVLGRKMAAAGPLLAKAIETKAEEAPAAPTEAEHVTGRPLLAGLARATRAFGVDRHTELPVAPSPRQEPFKGC